MRTASAPYAGIPFGNSLIVSSRTCGAVSGLRKPKVRLINNAGLVFKTSAYRKNSCLDQYLNDASVFRNMLVNKP